MTLPPSGVQQKLVREVQRQLSLVAVLYDDLTARIRRAHRCGPRFSLRPSLASSFGRTPTTSLLRYYSPESWPKYPTKAPEAAQKVASVNESASLVQKLWNYCNVLRDDGLSYQDYIEQLTFLLFLKMADEQTKPPFSRPAIVPTGLDWASLHRLDGDELDVQYKHILGELGKQPGTLGVIFRKAQNKVQDPAKLKRLVSDLIEKEAWMTLDADVKGDAYEGLLAKNAEDVKTGAGQYFTPRDLIKAIVDVMRPTARCVSWTRPADRRLPAFSVRAHEVGPPGPRREEIPARRRPRGLGDR